MRTPLKEIAEIRSGHTFRGKISEDPKGDLRVLQIKDLRGKTMITSDTLPLIKGKGIKGSYLIEPDDVVMPARGEHYSAALFERDSVAHEPVVASNQVFILKVNKNQILPGFLCWYLNQNEARNYLKSETQGSNIPFISKVSLANLPIKVPALEVQRRIVELMECWGKEKQLTKQLKQNRETMLKGIFQQLMEQ